MGPPAPHTVSFAVDGPIAIADVSGLCERLGGLLQGSGAQAALCDVNGVDPDAVTVDVLARLQLAARRQGCHVRLRHASSELLDLLDFMGLSEVLRD
jgi:ABC-type transporter Mla MlaB component